MGIESINENLAAAPRSSPRKRPVVIVMPDLEIPGNNARPWEMPMITASFNVRLTMSRDFGAFLSTIHNAIPMPLRVNAMSFGLRNTVSTWCSSKRPKIAPGIVAITI